MSRRILTFTVSLPLTRLLGRAGATGTAVTSTRQLEVLRKSGHELVTHRAQGGEVGDIVLIESTLGEHGVVASEKDVLLD